MATMNSGLGGPAGYGENVFSSTPLDAGNLDDGSVQVDVTSVFGASGINFFGTTYTSLYINSNGLITFGTPFTAYSPTSIEDFGTPAIAPFWSDVNINAGGEIYWDIDPANGKITITWDSVAPYQGSGNNSFQVVLTSNGSGDFDVEFIYETIEWTDGYQGDATVGLTDGGSNDFVLPGSEDPAALVDFPTDDFGSGDPDGTWELTSVGGVALPSNGIVDGTAGNDVIDAAYADDPENDFVDGADGTGVGRNADEIRGEGGNDTISAGAADDLVFGGTGTDTIYGGTGADILHGDSGDDTIIAGSSDTVYGESGDDTFTVDTTLGDTGNITIYGGSLGEDSGGDVLDLSALYAGGLINSGSLNFDVGNSENGSVSLTDGTLISFEDIENFICFARGTMISTATGDRPIEELSVGDFVHTRDHGLQELRWIGSREVSAEGKMAPILIKAGAMGNDTDLRVSPQHRMLVEGWKAELLYGTSEVLVAAKHLVNDVSIIRDRSETVEYFHFLLDSHEIVYANGTASESFHPGEEGFDALSEDAREEILTLFPELRCDPNEYGKAARTSLKGYEAEMLAFA